MNWSTIVPLDCEQRKRYTHKVSTINPGPQQVKRALSRMLHAVDRNRIFPSAGRGSQVCCDCKPESFPWCHGYAPIDLYDSSGAIIASFLRISYLVQHVKFRFSMVPGDPKNSSAGPALEFWGSSQTDPPSIFMSPVAHHVGYVPAGGPQKFQRRSCTGILGVPPRGTTKISVRICGQVK